MHWIRRGRKKVNNEISPMFCSLTMTFLVTGYLLDVGRIGRGLPDNIVNALPNLFFGAAYLMTLSIAERLKKKGINGVNSIAWATISWYILFSVSSSETKVWFSIVQLICAVAYVFWTIYGLARVSISVVQLIKDNRYLADNIDTAVAIMTSIMSILLTVIDFLM